VLLAFFNLVISRSRLYIYICIYIYTHTHTKERTAGTGQPKQDSQNRTARMGQPRLDRQNRTVEQGRHNRADKTGKSRTGQAEQDCQGKTARRATDCYQNRTASTGLPGQDSQNRNVRIVLLGPDESRDRTAGKAQKSTAAGAHLCQGPTKGKRQ
jgi:hypothetical protein